MKTPPRVLKNILHYVVLSFGALIILFPLYMTIAGAFKTPGEILHEILLPPRTLYLENIRAILAKHVLQAFLNSAATTVASVFLSITIVPMLAYGIIRNSGRIFFKIMLYLILGGIFIPFQVFMLSMVKQLGYLHLLSPFGVVIMFTVAGYPMNVFLYAGYLRTVPMEIEEAAVIDGCGAMRLFWRIVYAMIQPMTATIVILQGIYTWNDFLLPLLVLNRDQNQWTLPIFQYMFQSSQYAAQYNLIFAAFLFTIVPITLLYAFTQKYIISGMAQGALKG